VWGGGEAREEEDGKICHPSLSHTTYGMTIRINTVQWMVFKMAKPIHHLVMVQSQVANERRVCDDILVWRRWRSSPKVHAEGRRPDVTFLAVGGLPNPYTVSYLPTNGAVESFWRDCDSDGILTVMMMKQSIQRLIYSPRQGTSFWISDYSLVFTLHCHAIA